MGNASSLTGHVFWRLTVLAEMVAPPRVVCRCVCGNLLIRKRYVVVRGETKSCGCLKRDMSGVSNRIHGKANSKTKGYHSRSYGIWQAMKDRCANPNRKDYKHYGGRGISVCGRWLKFENFLADMGEPPDGETLDRVDTNGNYAPDNCRWASRLEQSNNTRRSLRVDGRPAREVAEEHGVTWWAVKNRVYNLGWSLESACTLAPNSTRRTQGKGAK